jgi:RNA polymerase sigma factor (sigma-70 family)
VSAGWDGEFRTFFDRHRVALVRWLTVRGAGRADAEDAAQVAFTQVWLRWPQLRNPDGYLYRVAFHELGRLWRARRQDDAACQAARVPHEEQDVSAGARLEAGTAVQVLLTLPARQRAVLTGYYDGFPDTHLADTLGVRVATIRSDRRHARSALHRFGAVLDQDPRGLLLRRAYADMRAGDPHPAGSRPVISQSWARSARHLTAPERGPAVAPLSDDELAQRRSISALDRICPAVCARAAETTGLMIVVADAGGWVLWRAGNRQALHRGEHDGHGEGACLAEHAVGTSGVSLSLAASHPVAVCGAEHYCPAQHDLVCAGAPLRHPADGRLLGAICISAPWPAAHRDMLKYIDQTARSIQQQIDPSRETSHTRPLHTAPLHASTQPRRTDRCSYVCQGLLFLPFLGIGEVLGC